MISGSAGCVLCLDAATALGDTVRSLYLFEPPFIVNDNRPPMPTDYIEHLESLVARGDRSAAVEYFMTNALLIPAEFVAGMKADPSWASMERYAHTYAYEGRICAGTQEGSLSPATVGRPKLLCWWRSVETASVISMTGPAPWPISCRT
ncbi:MAG TPA: hypothetical protein VFY56_00505 [Propionibacteriaceae bacterium]|nr:hypothetical protein [Propionibacteriaceae bacterium]